MSGSSTPKTNVRLESCTDSFTYCTIRAGIKGALSPLVTEFRVFVFGDDVFALRFSEFEVATYFMDDDSAFSAFQYVREPSISKFVTEVTEIK